MSTVKLKIDDNASKLFLFKLRSYCVVSYLYIGLFVLWICSNTESNNLAEVTSHSGCE